MLAKKTVKNQITLPKAIMSRFSGVDAFDVSTDGTCIVLRPSSPVRADEVRTRLQQRGIKQADISDAVAWARKQAAE